MKFYFFYILIFSLQILYGYSNNPPNGRTGAPGQTTCASGNCHNSYPLNSGPGEMIIDGTSSYIPGEILNFTLLISHPNQNRWGFQLCSLTNEMEEGGIINLTDDNNTQISSTSGITYLKQTTNGTFNGQQNLVEWDFEWEAPMAGTGPVTFYFSGNAANGNGTRSGDYIYINNFTLIEEDNECSLNGDVNLDEDLNILDVVTIVSYVLGNAEFNNEQFCNADINEDLNIDVLDIVMVVSIILN